ncbi:MAG: BatA domain-containing protein [Candidatus Riflebacteria bacterium]|nr:BatA domain-containing protein [Candidatus Riflebacteria bacterium]
MTFELSAAFWGLLALPVLLAIYLFRARFRDKPVSTLMFWQTETPPLAGGRRREPPRLPLFFYIELVIISLLVAAAAGPHLPGLQPLCSYVVVLDDSFSMRAVNPDSGKHEKGANSPRERAIKAVETELPALPFSTVRFILAGPVPQVMGEPFRSMGQIREALSAWSCLSPSSALDEAIALAKDLAGDRGRVLILTDHAPDHPVEDGKLRWMAFGEPLANFAFTQALRTRRDESEEALLEVVNLASNAAKTQLIVERDGKTESTQIELAPDEYRRVRLDLGTDAGTLTARLSSDALDIDSHVMLLPKPRRSVPVEVRVGEERLREALLRGLIAGGIASVTSSEPLLIFSDGNAALTAPAGTGEAWNVRFISESKAESFLGPFLIDRGKPLTEGVELRGSIWGAGRESSLPGDPIITAGNIPLVTVREGIRGFDVFWRLNVDRSNLMISPDWPILLYNLVTWRADESPGPDRNTLPLGSELHVAVPFAAQNVYLQDPDNREKKFPSGIRRLTISPEMPGLHNLVADNRSWQIAVNACSRDESDLRTAYSGEFGTWTDGDGRVESIDVAWMFLLSAILLLVIHAVLQAAGLPSVTSVSREAGA